MNILELAKKLYNTPETDILREKINRAEMSTAEENILRILSTLDSDLKLELDLAIGQLVISYEKQGFLLGYMVSKTF